MVSSTGAEKGSKLARFDLLPAQVMVEFAEHYGRGAEKYEDRNWEKGYDWSLSFAALNRHLWAFWNGEDIDPETGSKHIIAVMWHAAALAQFMNQNPEFDNRAQGRPPKPEGPIDPPQPPALVLAMPSPRVDPSRSRSDMQRAGLLKFQR